MIAVRSHLSFLLLCPALAAGVLACSAAPFERRSADGSLEKTGKLSGGKQVGPWTYFHPNGTKQSEGNYEHDAQVGPWTYWYADGTKEMEGAFADERRVGEWSFWYPNGALRAHGVFAQGFECGEWSFYDEHGALERRGDFDHGKPALRWTEYGPGEGARAEGLYLDGSKIGSWTRHDGASSTSVTTYPVPAGFVFLEESDEQGRVRRHGFLEGGTPHGLWVSFHANGARRLEALFEEGEPNGIVSAWNEGGVLLARGPVANGCLHGDWELREGQDLVARPLAVQRPRAVSTGAWSDSALAASLPAWNVVEAWLGELCAPVQLAPLTPPAVAEATAPADELARAREERPAAPVRAQPWTEREAGVLERLLKFYGDGAEAGRWDLVTTDGYDSAAPLSADTSPRLGAPSSGRRATPATLNGCKLPVTRFTCADGGTFDLAELQGGKKTVLTLLRGFGGQVCVYCAAQTKALAKAAREFRELETEVLVVYPGPESGVRAFLEAYERTFGAGERPPYRILYDSDLALTRALGLEDNMAVPSSLVLDKGGTIRWSHVAKDIADRPSVRELCTALSGVGDR